MYIPIIITLSLPVNLWKTKVLFDDCQNTEMEKVWPYTLLHPTLYVNVY